MRSMTPIALDEYDAQPFRFAASARLPANPQAVFDELGDMSLWFPMMRRSVWKTGATSGVGAEREVEIAMFGRFRERMLAWDAGRRIAFTMTSTTSPLVARMAEDWRLERTGDGVRLDWTVVAQPTAIGRPISPILRVVLRGMFASAQRTLGKRTAWSANLVNHAS